MENSIKLVIYLWVIASMAACSVSQLNTSTDGSLITSDSNSSSDVRVVRDEYGVPHIYADSVYGLYYGYGYSIAQDRLFQMEMARRSTQGIVSEVLGHGYVEQDKIARQLFSPESIINQIEGLSVSDRDIFEGYAAGFNAWLAKIDSSPTKLLPKQFIDYGFKPEVWDAYDVVMIFVGTMANRYGDFNTELDNVKILQALETQHGKEKAIAIFDLLNPRYTEGTPTTVPLADWNNKLPDNLSAAFQTDYPFMSHYSADDLKNYVPFTGTVSSGFSNCWVLGKDKVSEGNAILVNGPQFGWFAPAYTYSVGMHGAGIDVVGNTPFGYPMIMFGHNDSITWGSTWAAGDIVDIYAERLNPEDLNQYWYQDAWIDLESRTELIQVKGQSPESITLSRSVHGPIVHRDGNGVERVAYAKRRAWDGKELETLMSWIYATWADDYEGWLLQAKKSAINVNMYFADVEGNIGYFFGGQYPRRAKGHDNRLPARGDGSMDWQGRLPPSLANPHVLNPSGDYLVNWNNKPGHGVMNPDEFWYSWAEADRVDYLQHAIEEQPRFSADQAWDLIAQSSYADLHITYLSELIAQATETDKSLDGMGRLLQKWNGVYEDRNGDGYYDGPAPAIFRAFLGQLITEVLEDDLGDIYPYFSETGYPTPGKPTIAGTNIQAGFKAVFESLRGRGDFDLLNSVSAVDIVRQSLKKTQSLLTETKGRRMGRWKLRVDPRPYSKRNFLGVPQDFYQQPLMSPIEQNRGTENNMIVMSPDQIVGYEVAPPGQNAFVNSAGERAKNFEDQLELYENFGKKRMWFYPADVESNKVSDVMLMLPPR